MPAMSDAAFGPQPAPSGVADVLGTSDGRYEWRGLLGEGGSGRVYRAFDRVLGREIAIKTLKTLGPEDAYRLKKEFRTLVDVAHPHLIRLYDLVASGDRYFFTMELIEGPDLLAWVWRDAQPKNGRPLNESGIERLRRGMVQLVQDLQRVHVLGKEHDDIQ